MEIEEKDYPGGDAALSLPQHVIRRFSAQNQLDFEIAFYDGILARNPNYVEVLRVMGNNLTAKGDCERSLELDRRLTRLCPCDRIAQYNLACTYSRLGMIDHSLKTLARAFELGYDELDYVESDPDLDNVRKDPRFRELISRRRRQRRVATAEG